MKFIWLSSVASIFIAFENNRNEGGMAPWSVTEVCVKMFISGARPA